MALERRVVIKIQSAEGAQRLQELRAAEGGLYEAVSRTGEATRQSLRALRDKNALASQSVAAERQQTRALLEDLEATRRGPAAVRALANARELANRAAQAGVTAESALGRALQAQVTLQQRYRGEIQQVRQEQERAAQAALKAAREQQRAAQAATEAAQRQAEASKAATAHALRAAAVIAGVAVGLAMRKIVSEISESESAFAQLEAGIRSTGGAAGFTAQQLADYAAALQRTTTYSDEAVQRAQAILLTFTKIRGQNFTAATSAITNLATRMGTDLAGAALQVGKALNEPVEGAAALRRAGVQLSDQQEALVKKFMAANDIASAQKIILGELEKEFGGSAAAARNTLGGALKALNNQINDLAEEVGRGLSPALQGLIRDLTGSSNQSGALSVQATNLAKSVGQTAGFIIEAGRAVVNSYSLMRGFLASITATIILNGQAAVDAILRMAQGAASALSQLPGGGWAEQAGKQIASFRSGTLTDLKRLGEGYREVADEQLFLATTSAGATGAVVATGMAAGAASGQLALLTEKQQRAVDAGRAAIEQMREENAQRVRLLAATVQGADAVRAAQRQTAIENALRERRNALIGVGLTLGEAEARQIAEQVGRAFDLDQAQEHLNAKLGRTRELIDAASETLAKYGGAAARAALDVDEQGHAVAELTQTALALRLQLGGLTEGTELYTETLDQLARVEEARNRALRELPSIENRHQRAIDQSREALGLQIDEIHKQAGAFLSGAAAGQRYERQQRLIEAAGRAMASVVHADGETVAQFAKRLVSAAAEARAAMVDLFRREDAAHIMEPINESLLRTREIGMDVFADILSGARVNFEQIGRDLLRMWIRALAEMLRRWIATQAAMRATQVGAGAGGGGGYGSLLGSVAGLFGGSGGAGAATGVMSGPVDWGAAYVGGGSGGGVAAGGASLGAVAGVFGVYVALVLAMKNYVKTSGTVFAQGTIDLNREGKLTISKLTGSQERMGQMAATVNGLIKDVLDAVTNLGGTLEGFDAVTIARKGQGKKTDWRVIVNGIVEHFGQDAQAAYEFALVQALKNADIRGLSPIVAQAIHDSTARTVEQLQGQIATATEVSRLGVPEAGLAVRDAVQHFEALRRQMVEMLKPSEALTEALERIRQAQVDAIQNTRDQLLGITRDEEEIRQRNIDAFNLEIRARMATISTTLTQARVEYEAALLRARLTRNAAEGAILIGRAAGISEEALQAMADRIAGLERELADIGGLLITDEERHKKPVRRGGGGAGGGLDDVTGDRQGVRDLIRDSDVSRLSVYARGLTEINKKYDDAVPKAHGDAALIGEIARVRQLEIDALNKQTKQGLLDIIKPSAVKAIEDMRRQFDELRKLPASAGIPKWLVNLVEGKWLAEATADLDAKVASLQGVGSSLAQIQRNAEALKAEVLALGLGADETARRIAAINLGAQYQLQTGINGVLDRVFSLLAGNAKYAAQSLEFAKQKVQLEFALLRAQLDAFGVLSKYADLLRDAETEALRQASDSGVSSAAQQRAEALVQRQEAAAQAQKDAAERLLRATESLVELQRSLRNDPQLSVLTPEEQFAQAQATFRRLAAQAASGTVEQRAAAREQLAQFAARDYSTFARERFASSADFYSIAKEIDDVLGRLINNQPVSVGNVLYGQLAQAQEVRQLVSYASSQDASGKAMVTELRGLRDDSAEARAAGRETYLLQTDLLRTTRVVADGLARQAANDQETASAIRRILSKVGG